VVCDVRFVWNNHTRCPRGADIAATNDGGHSALHMAGTSSCRRNYRRPHVFILAAMRSFLDIVRLLVRKGAPVWATDKVPTLNTLQHPPSFLLSSLVTSLIRKGLLPANSRPIPILSLSSHPCRRPPLHPSKSSACESAQLERMSQRHFGSHQRLAGSPKNRATWIRLDVATESWP
jgi:hypothetical protein